MKKYFIYELKKSLLPIGMFTVICSLIYLVSILTSNNLGHTPYSLQLSTVAVLGGVLAACVSVWVFSYKMKKRSVDLFFSLPLSHTKILAVKFLIGLIAVFAPYVISYWLGAFTVMAKVYNLINAEYYAAHFFASLIPIYMIYAIAAFAFTRANRLEDGIVFIIFWALALFAVVAALDLFLENVCETYCIYNQYYMPFSALGTATDAFRNRIILDDFYNSPYFYHNAESTNMIVGSVLNVLLAAGASAGIFLAEKRTKSENVSQISESWFGYKVMIPLFTVCLSPFMWETVITGVLLAIFAFLVNVIYKRTIKIGKWQAIIYAISLLAGLILYIICSTAINT